MSAMNCSGNCSSSLDLIQLELDYFYTYGIYGIVILLVFCAIGTFGNVSVIWVYPTTYKKSTFTIFVLFLAGVDLFSSVLCIPLHIVDMRFRYTFMSAEFCKFIRFVTYSSSGASGMLLGVIAFERFRKICRPLKWQMSRRVVIRVCVGVIILALFICSPTLDFYGIAKTEVVGYPGIYGDICGPVKSDYNTVFFGILLLIGTVVVIMATVFYILIIKVVCRQQHYMADRTSAASNRTTVTSEIRSSNLLENGKEQLQLPTNNVQADKDSDNNYTTETTTSDNEPSFALDNQKSRSVSTVTRRKRKKANSMKRAIRSAFMFLVTSIVSYCGFLPVLIMSIIRAINSSLYDDIESNTGSLMDLLTRAYFFNSIANPIVYCFMDEKFRNACKAKYKVIFCRCCK
ncbi:hypothetical protein FSP39_020781 [Pinctada imbricata]|uniref:G-protein coupled receptors family 1 profile domain-containing protein n=1 Tax=Pinctada imbricata TaxID=66713 RepID=A0AA88Y099_PINIB|nr:hypothetical protein FSP39_020781 [Pinctada imbricata]